MHWHENDIDRLTPDEVRAHCAADPAYVAELDDFGYTPLVAACERRNLAVARVLIEAAADPNFTAGDGQTPLKAAIPPPGQPADLALFDLLLDAGAMPNAGCEPPLHHAVAAGHRALVAHLIDRGADPNLPDVDDAPPLFWAGVYAGPPDPDMMRLLVARGADPTRGDGVGRTLQDRIGPHAVAAVTASPRTGPAPAAGRTSA